MMATIFALNYSFHRIPLALKELIMEILNLDDLDFVSSLTDVVPGELASTFFA
jgi:hypothetical protein